jgi:cell wall-associated NlpC family hydrolase
VVKRRLLILLPVLAALILTGIVLHSPAASASAVPLRIRALEWAETQQGKPYEWGGTGPDGYDCSGLVMEAYLHAGVGLPRTTYEMLADGSRLRWVPAGLERRGDLAFYGSGHVELVWRWYYGWTWGAQEPGTVVGAHKWNAYWHPTAYYTVR